MQTQETLTNQYRHRSRSRNTSKLKLIMNSTTESSSSSSSSSSESSNDQSSSSSSSCSSGCQFLYEIGEKLDKYVITKYLSSGTFGMVLEVTDELGIPYAVKILSQTDHTEVEVLKQIQQFDPFGEAGIVRFYDYFAWQDYHCILLERVEYQTIKYSLALISMIISNQILSTLQKSNQYFNRSLLRFCLCILLALHTLIQNQRTQFFHTNKSIHKQNDQDIL
ncbi:unnamed protein product [Paramecium octaurelia]|uniref:Protein kinase domain-containing protein n=1 Tax=Paramecium octaurelia TaxID=43137 RepID=A0A8S1XIH2_PAROT|nr:unnamed protein product [Paramecium octaurelia]